MTDELDKDKLADGDPAAQEGAPVDPWAAAFGALEEKAAAAAAPVEERPAGDESDPAAPAAGVAGADDGGVDGGDDGGSLPAAELGGDPDGADAGYAPEEVISQLSSDAEQRAIDEMAELFRTKTDDSGRPLVRQSNGTLGASINDPDIYRIDEATGVATFFNPDTNKPFTGDNPRAQAKAWVEDYNDELRDRFNELVEERTTEIQQEMAPVVALLKFAPTFEALDPVRQQMLDALIEDYELVDENDNVIGYSVDLNQALAQVNRQIAGLQAQRGAGVPDPKAPTGPAVDMPTLGGAGGGNKPEVRSLAEAMEYEQDQQLAKLKK